jgi:hypothetical protein
MSTEIISLPLVITCSVQANFGMLVPPDVTQVVLPFDASINSDQTLEALTCCITHFLAQVWDKSVYNDVIRYRIRVSTMT